MADNKRNCDNPELEVLKGNTNFSVKLYKVLAQYKGNIFFSPISVHASLSMIYQGAKGTTAKLLGDILQVSSAQSAGIGYKEIINRLHTIPFINLSLANKIFVQEGSQLLDDFKSALIENFYSEVESIDFSDRETAVENMNNWVKKETLGKINDIIDEDDVNESLRLVLLNAIYFHGEWSFPFNRENTRNELFYVDENETVEVQMMHSNRTAAICYSDILEAKILKLPYGNDDVSMIFILPSDICGLAEVEQKLDQVNLPKLFEMESNNFVVEIAIPKFKIEQTIDLRKSLTTLGLGEIFNESRADLSGMVEGKQLSVSKIKQKSYIEVNEEDAEACTVIARHEIYMSLNYFIVNHPFIFFIGQKSVSATPLFAGKVVKP